MPTRILGQVDSGGRVLGQVQPTAQPPVQAEPQAPGLRQRLGGVLGGARERRDIVTEARRTGEQGLIQTGIQHAGGIIGLGFGLAGELPVIKQATELFGAGVEKLSETAPIKAVGEFVSPITELAVEKFEELTPAQQRTARGLGEIAAVVPVGRVARVVGPPVARGIKAVAPPVAAGVRKLGEARKEKALTRAREQVDELAGKIVQGKERDIQTAQKALSLIDTADVTTFKQLNTKVNDKIGELARIQDDLLDTVSDIQHLPDSLTRDIKVGEKTVSQNFVTQALEQLNEVYTKVNDPVNAEKINQLSQKLTTQGLTLREINDLAREHGREVSNKGFNKAGDPLTNINAVAFESTRTGLKTTTRDLFGGDKKLEALDDAMSNLIRVRKLTTDMVENVTKLQQRISERGFGEAVGRIAFQILDILTGKIASGFFRSALIPRGGGLKTLNALDLETNLNKNLKELQKITDKDLSENETKIILQQILNDIQQSSKDIRINQSTNSTKAIIPKTDMSKILPQKK